MNNETLTSIRARKNRLKADLDVLGPPQVVAALIEETHIFANTAASDLQQLKNDVSTAHAAEFSKWHGTRPPTATPVDDSRWTGILRAGGVAAVALEACFAASLAVMTFNMPVVAAAIAGVLITIAITVIFKAAWRVLTPDESRPRKGSQVLQRQLLVVLPLWMLCLTGVLFLGRALTEATPLANLMFSSLMTILTVLSPALAAILFSLGDLRGWQRKHVEQWRAIEKLEGDVRELDAYATTLERRLSSASQPLVTPLRGGKAAAAATAAALMLLVSGTKVEAAECRNQIWIDSTGSVSHVEMQAALDRALALVG